MKNVQVSTLRRWAREAVRGLRSLSAAGYLLIAVLLTLLIAAVVVAWRGWASAPDTDVPTVGYVALAMGVGFSLVVGIGLMALVFYSSRLGYDEPAELIAPDSMLKEPEQR